MLEYFTNIGSLRRISLKHLGQEILHQVNISHFPIDAQWFLQVSPEFFRIGLKEIKIEITEMAATRRERIGLEEDLKDAYAKSKNIILFFKVLDIYLSTIKQSKYFW